MKRLATCMVFVFVCLGATSALAVDSQKAQYMGGTITGVKEKAEGPVFTDSQTHFVFAPKPKDGQKVEIPYAGITGLEYGQNVSRRVVAAVFISPLALFAKKRAHYLTITYKDASGMDHAAVFELGKGIVRTTLAVLQTRSGKEVEYQDEESRKAGFGR